VNSITLNQSSELTNSRKLYGLSLDASMANPDVDKDGRFRQGPLSPVLTNARLRLSTNFTLNGETLPLQSEGPLFTINPLSNFTIRVMLEGYHQGNQTGRIVNNLGSNYNNGGLTISLYTDNSGELGNLVATGNSFNGYTERDPAHLNRSRMTFGNVEFRFTDITNGHY
jgi:hypothetical protein